MKSYENSAPVRSDASPDEITLQLDGRPHRVPTGSALADLVAALGHAPQAVSTAVNGEFVARAARGRVLAEGDQVLLFQPIVGG